jgi:hypothetical protein
MDAKTQRVLTEYCKTYGVKLGFWDTTFGRIRVPKPEVRSCPIYDENRKTIERYITGGYTPEVLAGLIKDAFKAKKRIRFVSEIFPAEKTSGAANICTGAEYHPELFTPMQRPVYRERPDGSYERVAGASKPERKGAYTMDDLLSYYYKKAGERPSKARDLAGLKWLLENLEDGALDLTLYMIDIASEHKRDGHFVDLSDGPLGLKSYLLEAEERFRRKRCLGKIA